MRILYAGGIWGFISVYFTLILSKQKGGESDMVIDLGTNYSRTDIENLQVMYKGQGGEVLTLDKIGKDFCFSTIYMFCLDKPLIALVIQVKEVSGNYEVLSVKGYDTLPEKTQNFVKGIIENY